MDCILYLIFSAATVFPKVKSSQVNYSAKNVFEVAQEVVKGNKIEFRFNVRVFSKLLMISTKAVCKVRDDATHMTTRLRLLGAGGLMQYTSPREGRTVSR